MTITTQIFLSDVEFGVPSGNYDGSSTDWFSDALTAANYYRGRGGLQTVTFRVTGFIGKITVEASLDTLAETASWFQTYEFGDPSSVSPLSDYHPVTITGNFVWMRLRIEGFEAGVIDSVTISY
jgi:hypothetical protein